MRTLLLAAGAAGLLVSPLSAQWREGGYSEDRQASVPVAGARRIDVSAAAGSLRIEGREGQRSVEIRAVARAGRRERLADIRLIAERDGDRIRIETDRSDRSWSRDDDWVAMDLVITVPADLPLEVRDGSGDVVIRGTGAVAIRDGSGDLRIENVHGDVRIEDGSGGIEVRDVRGAVTVASDGSGEIELSDVTGDARVERDGSGSISVRHVGGGFYVGRKGSGSITHVDVQGSVDVPSRNRRYRSSRRVRL